MTGNPPEAAALIKALNHSIRRSILRILLRSAPASSTQIRDGIPGLVGNKLNFHLTILVTSGAVARERKRVGHRESFYAPTDAIQVPWFLTALQLTAAEDQV